MGAFASDDEGSFFFKGAELKIAEHVAKFLATALHPQGTHPIAFFPVADSERKPEIGDSGSYRLLETLNISHFHDKANTSHIVLTGTSDYDLVTSTTAVRRTCAGMRSISLSLS